MSTVKYERLDEAKDIMSWAQQKNAQPAERELADGDTELTFNVDGKRDGDPLEWNEFLQRFRLEDLALLVEPAPSTSHYFKIVNDSSQKAAIQMGPSRGDDLKKGAQTSDFRAK
jgi:hypothetical protein